jgi:hypothetical protein
LKSCTLAIHYPRVAISQPCCVFETGVNTKRPLPDQEGAVFISDMLTTFHDERDQG